VLTAAAWTNQPGATEWLHLDGRSRASDGQEVPGAGVARGVTQLRHGPGFDLADPLPGQVEVLPHLFEGAGLAPVQAETQLEDLPLTLVERREQAGDLLGQERGGGHLEGGLGRA